MQCKYLKWKQKARWGDYSIAEYYCIDKRDIFTLCGEEVGENAETDIFSKEVAQW